MKNYQKTLAALLVSGAMIVPTMAHAQGRFHHNKPTAPLEVRTYKEYEHREPCQQYKPYPTQMPASHNRCIEGETSTTDTSNTLLPVVATYTIYFDFNKSNLTADQKQTINKLISDVNTYHPTQITVTGHTDTSGSAEYNEHLSAKRADTVSKALSSQNVASFYLNEAALGEQDLAVPTPDNTKLSSNRRVVVQFRK